MIACDCVSSAELLAVRVVRRLCARIPADGVADDDLDLGFMLGRAGRLHPQNEVARLRFF